MWTMAEGKAPQANLVALQCSDTPAPRVASSKEVERWKQKTLE